MSVVLLVVNIILVVCLIRYGIFRFRGCQGDNAEYVWVNIVVYRSMYFLVGKSSRALTRGMRGCLGSIDYSGVRDGRYCVVLRRYSRWDSGSMDSGSVSDWVVDEFFER